MMVEAKAGRRWSPAKGRWPPPDTGEESILPWSLCTEPAP